MAATIPHRVILIVLDSVGAGELPDAAAYGDEGSNTLGNIARVVPLRIPGLRSLGLDRIVDIGERSPETPIGAYGRMAERSPGKDSVTGHWEMAGLVLDRPFPTFPDGFPAEVIAEFERRIGRESLANTVASGTAIIEALGDEHVSTGKPIVYTSADSVFQIAAHEDVVPVEELYRWCEIAFEIVGTGMGVGRVIARPFAGKSGSLPAHRQSQGLRAHAVCTDAARRPQGCRTSSRCGRQDRGSVRRPRYHRSGPYRG